MAKVWPIGQVEPTNWADRGELVVVAGKAPPRAVPDSSEPADVFEPRWACTLSCAVLALFLCALPLAVPALALAVCAECDENKRQNEVAFALALSAPAVLLAITFAFAMLLLIAFLAARTPLCYFGAITLC